MCPISGGNWNNVSNAGVWTLNLNNVRTNSNDNVGFRSDSIRNPRIADDANGGIKGGAFLRRVREICRLLFFSSVNAKISRRQF